MKTTDYHALCNGVCDIAREAGNYILQQLNNITHTEIEQKGHHNYVTYVDKSAEELIVNRLKDLLPGFMESCGFILVALFFKEIGIVPELPSTVLQQVNDRFHPDVIFILRAGWNPHG